MLRKTILTAAFLVAGAFGASAQQGAFPNYPTVGVPADTQCLSYGNNNRCTQFRPAGPTAVTGVETVPADTNQAAGQPQTVRIPSAMLLSGGTPQIVTTGTSGTVANGVTSYIMNGVGAAYAATMPAAPWNGQIVEFANPTAVAIATFSVAANTGQSLVGVAPTAIAAQSATTANVRPAYRYNTANTTWYRVQ